MLQQELITKDLELAGMRNELQTARSNAAASQA